MTTYLEVHKLIFNSRKTISTLCLLLFVLLSKFESANTNSLQTTVNEREICSQNTVYLQKCQDKISKLDIGIPSNPEKVDVTCRAFEDGMQCFEKYLKFCLKPEEHAKIRTSVSGAKETFDFLCKDSGFRRDFLKHGKCYERISEQWDKCTNDLISSNNLPGTQHRNIELCCAKLKFFGCISEIVNRECTKEGANFLKKMAETLVRTSVWGTVSHCTSTSMSARCQKISYSTASSSSIIPGMISSRLFQFQTDLFSCFPILLIPATILTFITLTFSSAIYFSI